jgi:hypothetical protein
MKHPSIETLALYAGGELSGIAKCAACSGEVEAFRAASMELASGEDVMPAGVNWDRLSAEMRANIHLGLEASEAIRAYEPRFRERMQQGMSWRVAVVAAAFVVMLCAGYWFTAMKKAEMRYAARGPEPVVIEATDRGVGFSDGSRAMELKNPDTVQRPPVVTVSTDGAAATRYIDEETGQVTVNNVYLE